MKILSLLLTCLLLSLCAAEEEFVDSQLRSRQLAVFSKCGFSSSQHHDTWFRVLFTNSPVLFPQDDVQLAYIATTAKDNGCKVRVRGAGHSEDGVVMQKLDELDENVVVVNLKDYTPNDTGWQEVINPGVPSIKISSGASTLKLMSKIRPQGYLLPSNTAGRLFSIGGVYQNPSVIGSTYGESRLAAQVLSVRVMDAYGNINIYSGDDVKAFRGSMGLLGIVTAMEIKIRPDIGLRMFRDSLLTKPFDKEAARAWFNLKLGDNDGTEFFYYVHEDTIDALSLDYNGNSPLDSAALQATQGWYDDRLAQFPDLAYTGGQLTLVGGFVELLAGFITMSQSFAKTIGIFSRQTANSEFDAAATVPNDGHFVPEDNIPLFESLFYNIKCAPSSNCADEMTDVFETTRQFLKTAKNTEGSSWYPTLPLEWRVFEVQSDEMLLEHLEPGKYIALEVVSLSVEGGTDYEYSKFHKQLEDMWRNMFPDGGIHHGKGWGYGSVPGVGDNGEEFPFQNDTITDAIYPMQVRNDFIAKMNLYDPTQTFRAGSGLRMLGLTTKKYTPKQYNGDSCQDYQDPECISSCCDFVFFGDDKCVPSDKAKYARCKNDCECAVNTSGDPCRWTWYNWVKKCRD